ncbi:hypothetical protein T484DRAFT_1759528 [Baffinella frigidus]|nr:hypothetical protein T484DRAFT_1759528 [Cryptophyta sp. CCMP2293]
MRSSWLTFLVEEGVVTWALSGDEVEETVERVPDLENLSVYELVEDGAWRPGFPAWVVKRFKPDGKGKALESASRVSSRATLRAPCRAPATLLLPAALVGSHTQVSSFSHLV